MGLGLNFTESRFKVGFYLQHCHLASEKFALLKCLNKTTFRVKAQHIPDLVCKVTRDMVR